jgi:hypothetical protein
MQFGKVALMIEEVQMEHISTWVSVWYHVKQETITNIFVYNRNIIHFNNDMLYSSSLDETNSAGYTSKVQ